MFSQHASSLQKRLCSLFLVALGFVFVARWPVAATSAPAIPIKEKPKLVCDETGCPAAIANTTYDGWDAYQLCDGKTYAIVVPAIGRVMAYGLVENADYGRNWLWNGNRRQEQKRKPSEWKNWGGDKTWLAPQSFWSTIAARGGWPPDPAWDGKPYEVEVLTGGIVRTVGAVSARSGTRIIREYWHDDATGDFIIRQTAEKVTGEPLLLSLWSVTQILPPEAVFIPINPDSPYKNSFHFIVKTPNVLWDAGSAMLKIRPLREGNFKVGADSPVSSIAAVNDGMAFVQRTARPAGDYPDGALGAGFPVELYNSGNADAYYQELELLSPLRRFIAGVRGKPGTRWTHTMRWSLHRLPEGDVDSQAVQQAVQELLLRTAVAE